MSWERADPWICRALCVCGILMTKGGCQDLPWLVLWVKINKFPQFDQAVPHGAGSHLAKLLVQ